MLWSVCCEDLVLAVPGACRGTLQHCTGARADEAETSVGGPAISLWACQSSRLLLVKKLYLREQGRQAVQFARQEFMHAQQVELTCTGPVLLLSSRIRQSQVPAAMPGVTALLLSYGGSCPT